MSQGGRLITHNEHRRRQAELLRRLLELLAADPSVLGAAAGGSYARGDNDAFSDLDLWCFLRDEARTGREELHRRGWEPGDPAYVGWFLWMFRQVYAWSKRGAQGGERALAKLFNAADSLHQIRASLTDMRLWTLDHPWNLAAVDRQAADELATTYVPLLPEELCAATRALLAVYERVCPDYCAKAGIPYPAERVTSLRRVLDEFDVLR